MKPGPQLLVLSGWMDIMKTRLSLLGLLLPFIVWCRGESNWNCTESCTQTTHLPWLLLKCPLDFKVKFGKVSVINISWKLSTRGPRCHNELPVDVWFTAFPSPLSAPSSEQFREVLVVQVEASGLRKQKHAVRQNKRKTPKRRYNESSGDLCARLRRIMMINVGR